MPGRRAAVGLIASIATAAGLIIAISLVRQSQVEACPLPIPMPLECRPQLRGGIALGGYAAVVVHLLAATFAWRSTGRARTQLTLLLWGTAIAAALAALAAIVFLRSTQGA